MSRLLEYYRSEVVPKLMKEMGYKNVYEVPRIIKIVINSALGEAISDPKIIDVASSDLSLITGQKPIVIKAKRNIASFKLRKGIPIALKVTLRKSRAYDFLDRLINFALPRVKDFRGLPRDGFDGHGNYNFGIDEHTIFPEIDIDKVQKVFGMDITIVTSAKDDKSAYELLKSLNFPFERG
ncbi:MAG: 50S ribosomal protein L5 [Candidatus Hydrothermia bacterium]|jgi:large subunit ribosomal protein L5